MNLKWFIIAWLFCRGSLGRSERRATSPSRRGADDTIRGRLSETDKCGQHRYMQMPARWSHLVGLRVVCAGWNSSWPANVVQWPGRVQACNSIQTSLSGLRATMDEDRLLVVVTLCALKIMRADYISSVYIYLTVILSFLIQPLLYFSWHQGRASGR